MRASISSDSRCAAPRSRRRAPAGGRTRSAAPPRGACDRRGRRRHGAASTRLNTAWIASRSACGIAASSRPDAERRTRPTPVQMMCAATASATSGSSRSQPVANTSATPMITPDRRPDIGHQMLAVGFQRDAVLPAADAHQHERDAEIDRRCRRGQRKAEHRRIDRARLDAARGMALGRIPAAASTMSAPSMPAAKYSALEKP